jgi:hypothetical protein
MIDKNISLYKVKLRGHGEKGTPQGAGIDCYVLARNQTEAILAAKDRLLKEVGMAMWEPREVDVKLLAHQLAVGIVGERDALIIGEGV